jgi:hypothetical protein
MGYKETAYKYIKMPIDICIGKITISLSSDKTPIIAPIVTPIVTPIVAPIIEASLRGKPVKYHASGKKIGREVTDANWVNDPEYFKKKYHIDNVPEICSCGQIVNHRQLYKHKKTKKHTVNLLKLLGEL